MILTDQQEQLSLAVLHATCARAGFGFHISGRIQDNWGWDAQADVKERLDPASALFNFRLRFQLKATRQQLTQANGRYSFPLEVRHYNHFRVEAGYDSPIYLVVFQMPHGEDEWLSCSREQLVLRRCLRWVSPRNAPVPDRADQETIIVYLPEKQVLTPEALRELARTRSLEQWINYEVEGIAHADHA
ncbi:MAG: DUF4365 domain-containing protein [Planctomycetales bacterium]